MPDATRIVHIPAPLYPRDQDLDACELNHNRMKHKQVRERLIMIVEQSTIIALQICSDQQATANSVTIPIDALSKQYDDIRVQAQNKQIRFSQMKIPRSEYAFEMGPEFSSSPEPRRSEASLAASKQKEEAAVEAVAGTDAANK